MRTLDLKYRLFTNPWLSWGLLILQVIVVVALSAKVMKMATGAAALLFLLYLALVGNQAGSGGLVVIGALKLYLDYINMFLLILRASNR